jgi:hypothetical protein
MSKIMSIKNLTIYAHTYRFEHIILACCSAPKSKIYLEIL